LFVDFGFLLVRRSSPYGIHWCARSAIASRDSYFLGTGSDNCFLTSAGGSMRRRFLRKTVDNMWHCFPWSAGNHLRNLGETSPRPEFDPAQIQQAALGNNF